MGYISALIGTILPPVGLAPDSDGLHLALDCGPHSGSDGLRIGSSVGVPNYIFVVSAWLLSCLTLQSFTVNLLLSI